MFISDLSKWTKPKAFTDKGSKYIADVLFSVFIGISWGLLDCFFRLSARGPVPMRFIFQVTAVLKYLYSHTTDGPNYLDPVQFAEKGVTVYSYLASITVLNDTKMIFSYALVLTKIIIPLIFVVCFTTFMAVVMNSIWQVFWACIPEGSLKARLGHFIFH